MPHGDNPRISSLGWRQPTGWSFSPFFVWANRLRLLDAKSFRFNVGKDKILWRHRNSREPPEHGELTRMSHRIRERPLKQTLRRHVLQQRVPASICLATSSSISWK